MAVEPQREPEQRVASLLAVPFRHSRRTFLTATLGAAGLYLSNPDSSAASTQKGPAILRPPRPEKRYIDSERFTTLGVQKMRYFPDDNEGDVVMELRENLLVDLKEQPPTTEFAIASIVDLFEKSEYDLEINTAALFRTSTPEKPFIFGLIFGRVREKLAQAVIGPLDEREAARMRSIEMSWRTEYITDFLPLDARKKELTYRRSIKNLKSSDPQL